MVVIPVIMFNIKHIDKEKMVDNKRSMPAMPVTFRFGKERDNDNTLHFPDLHQPLDYGGDASPSRSQFAR